MGCTSGVKGVIKLCTSATRINAALSWISSTQEVGLK
jgi:hypothetical protein